MTEQELILKLKEAYIQGEKDILTLLVKYIEKIRDEISDQFK